MSLNARFTASFDDFKRQVDSANSTLGVFERGTKNAARELTRLEEAYSGQRVVARAVLTAEAVERIGGASKLSAAELEGVGRIADEATAKLLKMGQTVPAGLAVLNQQLRVAREDLSQFGVVSVSTNANVSALSTTYRQFDGVLQAAGIQIGAQVKGLEDIAAAAGSSASKLGLVGTAGLTLGTGVAAWGITRAAMEFTGLDKAVEGAWRSVLRYGDVAEQVAGAKQDAINRAIAMGADANISYRKSIEFVEEATRRGVNAKIDWTQKLSDAHREVRNLTDAQRAEIEIAQSAGATTQQLTDKYGLSAQALTILADRQRTAAAATREHEQAQMALDRAYNQLMSTVKNANQMAIFEEDAERLRRQQNNQKGLDLMDRDERLMKDRKAFDDAEQVEKDRLEWERNFLAEQAALDAEHAARVQVQVQRSQPSPSLLPRGPVGSVPGLTNGGIVPADQYFRRYPMADGGLIHGPTNIIAGERGPEAIVPLPKLSMLGNAGGNVTVHINMTGVLLSNDAAGKKILRDTVGGAVLEGITKGKKV